MSLIAVTRAEIGSESPKLNGGDLKTETEIVHAFALMMDNSFSASQVDKSFSKVPVFVLISTL